QDLECPGQPRCGSFNAAGQLADYGCYELVETKQGRCWNPRQDDSRPDAVLVSDRGQTKRFTGLEGDAVNHDPWGAQIGNHPVRKISLALGSAAGQQDDVKREGLHEDLSQSRMVVADDAQEHRLAALLADRVGQNGGVTVEDLPRPK